MAFPIINNIAGVNPTSIEVPVPASQTNAYMCVTNASGAVTTIAPGGTADSSSSGNPYFFGADLRYSGCATTDPYIGYLSVNLTASSIDSSTPPTFAGQAGIHLTVNDLAANSSTGSITGQVAYTQIQPNVGSSKTIYPPQANTSSWDFAGINLSGLEFGAVINPYVIPNLSAEDSGTDYTDLPDTQLFINGGVNTVRVPMSWDYLLWNSDGGLTTGAPLSNQSLTSYYTNYVAPILQTLTSAGVYTILDLHTYFRYSIYGSQYSGCNTTPISPGDPTSPCPDGTLNTNLADYTAVWGQLLTAIQDDPQIDENFMPIRKVYVTCIQF